MTEKSGIKELESNEDYKYVADYIKKNGKVKQSKDFAEEITHLKKDQYREIINHFDVTDEMLDKMRKATLNLVGGGTLYAARQMEKHLKEAKKHKVDPTNVNVKVDFDAGDGHHEKLVLHAHKRKNNPSNPGVKVDKYVQVDWTSK